MIICMMKYTIIVHWQTVRKFGEDKAKEIFFWLDLLLPVIDMALHILLQPDFFFVLAAFEPANKCLGEIYQSRLENNETVPRIHNLWQTMTLFEFSEYNWINYAIFISRKIICVLQTTVMYLLAMNAFEIFFYYKTFSFGKR